jgi:hypothetical protein
MNKKLMALVGVIAVCMILAVVSNALAADANQPKGTPKEKPEDLKLVIGIVTVAKASDGNIAEIKVTSHRELIYKVVLDAKGIEVGKTMADKRVRIEGTIEKKGEVQWITVKTFGEARSQLPTNPNQPTNPKPKPAPKPNQ